MRKLAYLIEDTFLAIAIGALLLFASGARADEVAAVASDAVAYSTEQQAAEAALEASEAISRDTELAGGIVLTSGTYYFTTPVSSGLHDHFDIRLQFRGKLVAIYHTHPGANSGLADQFSPEDYAVARKLKLPSYMRAISTQSNYRLSTGNTVSNLTGHSLCHGIECKDYYALARHQVAVLYGQVQR